MKKALIIGVTGQDGAYLAKFLLSKGYEVWGGYRRTSRLNIDNLKTLGIYEEIKMVPLDLVEQLNIFRVIESIEPDEVYNLGAQSFVEVSFQHPLTTAEITGLGTLRVLEAIRTLNPKIKFYQASSSEMFGNTKVSPQNEETPFEPVSPYGTAKLFAHQITKNYREGFNIFACCGILFNHESPLRGLEFVTRKITHNVARIKYGLSGNIKIGNLEACRDWGYAPEYVEAMWLMLQQDEPDDFVIATGESHSVREFLEAAFSYVNMNWEEYTIVDETLKRPTEIHKLVGDARKAKKKLGWQPRTSFKELVQIMVDYDLNLARKEIAP